MEQVISAAPVVPSPRCSLSLLLPVPPCPCQPGAAGLGWLQTPLSHPALGMLSAARQGDKPTQLMLLEPPQHPSLHPLDPPGAPTWPWIYNLLSFLCCALLTSLAAEEMCSSREGELLLQRGQELWAPTCVTVPQFLQAQALTLRSRMKDTS